MEDELDLDIHEIFNEITKKTTPGEPNSYPISFELNSLKECFEFLLQLLTMLCKHFYGDDNNQVNLSSMTSDQFENINKYMLSIGFTCIFKGVPANSHNINNTYTNRYDRITITSQTKLEDLIFGIKCENIIYIVSFGYCTNY